MTCAPAARARTCSVGDVWRLRGAPAARRPGGGAAVSHARAAPLCRWARRAWDGRGSASSCAASRHASRRCCWLQPMASGRLLTRVCAPCREIVEAGPESINLVFPLGANDSGEAGAAAPRAAAALGCWTAAGLPGRARRLADGSGARLRSPPAAAGLLLTRRPRLPPPRPRRPGSALRPAGQRPGLPVRRHARPARWRRPGGVRPAGGRRPLRRRPDCQPGGEGAAGAPGFSWAEQGVVRVAGGGPRHAPARFGLRMQRRCLQATDTLPLPRRCRSRRCAPLPRPDTDAGPA